MLRVLEKNIRCEHDLVHNRNPTQIGRLLGNKWIVWAWTAHLQLWVFTYKVWLYSLWQTNFWIDVKIYSHSFFWFSNNMWHRLSNGQSLSNLNIGAVLIKIQLVRYVEDIGSWLFVELRTKPIAVFVVNICIATAAFTNRFLVARQNVLHHVFRKESSQVPLGLNWTYVQFAIHCCSFLWLLPHFLLLIFDLDADFVLPSYEKSNSK